MNKEYIFIIDKLETSFKNSIYDHDKKVFRIKKNSHTDLLRLKVIEEDTFKLVKCRILERLAPLAIKYQGYSQKWRNDRVKEEIKEGLNKFFNKDFNHSDIELINDKIGSATNRLLAKKFVDSDCNMEILRRA